MEEGTPDRAESGTDSREPVERRNFLGTASGVTMTGGLVASYGMFGFMAIRFLYDTDDEGVGVQFLTTVDALQVGESMTYVAPSGEKIVVARQGKENGPEDFVALSSVCPHLGCQVHWEPQNRRFFCPCHNGAFDALGRATEGPPEKAGQELKRYPLLIRDGSIFIEAPLKTVTAASARVAEVRPLNETIAAREETERPKET